MNPDTASEWGVSPSVFRSMVVVHTTIKFRDLFGPLDSDQIGYITNRLMDAFYSLNFVSALETAGVEKMNALITAMLDTYEKLGDNK